ncbi:MAG: peptidase M28, partial [Candidatus Angelobacter sp.]
MNIPRRLAATLLCAFCVFATSRSIAQEKVDLEAITRIRYEGFHDSKVMEIASGLMDEIGERLTGSPNMKRANDWTRDKLTEFGLTNAHLEPWGPFGRGWVNEYVNVRMVSPDVAPLLAYAKAWTPGTNGTVTGKVIRVNIRLTPDMASDMAKYRGKLAGKIVLFGEDPEIKPSIEPLSERYTDKSLAEIGEYQIPGERNLDRFRLFQRRGRLLRQLNKFFEDEKVLAVIDHSRGAIGGGTVFVQSGGSYKEGQTVGTPQLTMAQEHWD